MRIVQLANLYSPVSGGLRTAVDMLGRGYAAAGHERALVIPGREHARRRTASGTVVTVPGPSVAPGYRLVLDPRPVLRALARLRPDVIEVSDKATLTVAARWARRNGVRSVLLSHERLDAILAPRVPGGFPLRPVTDRWNGGLARAFDAIVATSAFGIAEFDRVGAPSLHLVPLGVDLDTFRPMPGPEHGPASDAAYEPASDAAYEPVFEAASAETGIRLMHLGRLSKEKRPDLALAAAIELQRRGLPVRLDLVGDGPLAAGLRAAAARARLPVRFHGHVPDRAGVARLLSGADVVLATCPIESFGLAVLEALACGTPVVAADRGAAPELLVPGAGVAVPPVPARFADGVQEILAWPRERRRAAARARAERYPWDATVAGMLDVLTASHRGR